MKRIFSGLAACAALAAFGSAASTAAAQDKPVVAVWGADIDQVRTQLAPACAGGLEVRRFDPAELPGVQDHRQIDCRGFAFMGAPRTAEFVFAEGRLQLVWILMEAADEGRVTAGLREQFGAPAVDNPGVTAFPAGRAAWRKDKPEVLFYAPQLDAMMNQFLGL
jgi:hypothetical protein